MSQFLCKAWSFCIVLKFLVSPLFASLFLIPHNHIAFVPSHTCPVFYSFQRSLKLSEVEKTRMIPIWGLEKLVFGPELHSVELAYKLTPGQEQSPALPETFSSWCSSLWEEEQLKWWWWLSACQVSMVSCLCLPGEDVASPGEFVHHFQLHTKDFTTTEVPLTICNKHKGLPAFVREMQQETSKKSAKLEWITAIRSPKAWGLHKFRIGQGRREPTSSLLSQQWACWWSQSSSSWVCSVIQYKARKAKENSGNRRLDHQW